MAEENKNIAVEQEEFSPSDFELVHDENYGKIHDQKFETKATTFAKDALKRFCKNKSSVVGAIIIGLLLVGSFVSVFSPHDIKNNHADQKLLTPKLFKAGTGWWDGCIEYHDIPYDNEIEGPADFNPDCVLNMTFNSDDVEYIDQYFRYATGGYLRPTAKHPVESDPDANTFYLYNFTYFDINSTNNTQLDIEFADFENIAENAELADSYRICIQECKGKIKDSVKDDWVYPVTDWISDYSSLSINLSEKLASIGKTEIEKGRVHIEVKPKISTTKRSYILIKTLNISVDTEDEETLENLEEICISDANHTAGLGPNSAMEYPVGYWRSNSIFNVYRAEKRTVNFRYDKYKAVLGDIDGFVIGGSIMQEYIDKGWCEFSNFYDVSTFKVLNEKKCPIKSVIKADYDSSFGGVWNFTTVTTYYKYLGYSSMPRYVFGTDNYGHDLLTVALSSLKTSLLVAIISSSVCLVIGLIYGSIAGYFGGNVDIIMERFTDIIGGVPWIVMMTLIILLLGNSVVTFAIALVMTGWIGTSSTTRTQFYRFKGREYVLASRTLGSSDMRLIFKHILPNSLGTIVTSSVLMIPSCIFSEASISYLGLGLKGVNSFGVLLSTNQQYLNSYPLLIIVPAIIISLLMISFNLFGNGLRDALNPTLKGGEQ